MTPAKPPVSNKSGKSYFAWIRAVIGMGILFAVAYWVYREGSLLRQINAWALICSILIVQVINIVSAALLCIIARIYHRKLSFRLALYIGALGSLGNASGGLPIGTTLKYAILRQKTGLTIGQITFGLVSVTVVISLSLLVVTAVSIISLEFPPGAKIIPLVLFIGGMGTVMLLVRWSCRYKRIAELVKPVLARGLRGRLALFGCLLALLFVVNYVVVGYFVLPERSMSAVAFMSASAMLLSIVSFLQSIGGIQEIVMGFTAFLTGAQMIEGVQLALIIRLTVIIASSLTIAWYFLVSGESGARSIKTAEHGDADR